ncbi:MAG: retropepsin-like aspartic protease [Phycisphaeraceae bacterium]
MAGCSGVRQETTYTTVDAPPLAVVKFGLPRNLPVAHASVNGKYIGFFLLDTGSSVTVLDAGKAVELGLTPHDSARLRAIGGAMDSPVVHLDQVVIRGVDFGAQDAVVVDLGQVSRSIHLPIAGILGFGNLRDQVFTLDFTAGTITIEDRVHFVPPPADVASEHRLMMVGGLPAVPGSIGSPGDPRGKRYDAWLQIDTGSNAGLSLPYDWLRQNPRLVAQQHNRMGQVTGAGGAATTVGSRISDLEVFGRRLADQDISIELQKTGPATRGGAVIGRLGNGVLRDFVLTFDLGQGKLWAKWRPMPR